MRNRTVSRNKIREQRKNSKIALKKKLAEYRKGNDHITIPPSRKGFPNTVHGKRKHKEILAQYNRDLIDYIGYKDYLFRKALGMTKQDETYNGWV